MTGSYRDINRGAITLSPNVSNEWVASLIDQAADVEPFHICEDIEFHDGARMVLFCDGSSCTETCPQDSFINEMAADLEPDGSQPGGETSE